MVDFHSQIAGLALRDPQHSYSCSASVHWQSSGWRWLHGPCQPASAADNTPVCRGERLNSAPEPEKTAHDTMAEHDVAWSWEQARPLCLQMIMLCPLYVKQQPGQCLPAGGARTHAAPPGRAALESPGSCQ